MLCALKEFRYWVWHTDCQKLQEKKEFKSNTDEEGSDAGYTGSFPYGHHWIDSSESSVMQVFIIMHFPCAESPSQWQAMWEIELK